MQAKAVYATQGTPLRNQIQRLLKESPVEPSYGRIHAVIVPDSNLLDLAKGSARVFAALRDQTYRHVVMVAPSHSSKFKRINVCSLDSYRTPLGEVPISSRLRDELCDEDDDIFIGDEGHFHTHGVDAQLPFLQTVLGEFELVPIVMGDEGPDLCRELGHAIGEIMYNQATLVVACAGILRADEEALAEFRELLEAGDSSGLMRILNGDRMHVIGKGALVVALLAALKRNAKRVTVTELVAPEGDTPGYLGAILST